MADTGDEGSLLILNSARSTVTVVEHDASIPWFVVAVSVTVVLLPAGTCVEKIDGDNSHVTVMIAESVPAGNSALKSSGVSG